MLAALSIALLLLGAPAHAGDAGPAAKEATSAAVEEGERPVPAAPEVRILEVVVQGGRYEPAELTVREGERVAVRFLRREWSGCTREVVFPSLGLRRELPPNEPVLIELGVLPVGETPFHCGMNMVHGRVRVEAK